MPQMDLNYAQELIGRVAENPGATRELADRELIEALATVIVRNGLLFVAAPDETPDDG